MKRLVRLYPTRWRRRYGDELEQLITDLQPISARTVIVLDLLRGALAAHIETRFSMDAANRAAIRRGALVAGAVGLAIAVEILLSNVVFPTTGDDDSVPVILSYLGIFVSLFVVGVLAQRAGADGRGQVFAGLIAGAMIGALTIAAFVIVDNVWLDVVSQQQTKIDGLARSSGTDMRAYINHGLIGPGLFFIVVFGLLGAALSAVGGAVGGWAAVRGRR